MYATGQEASSTVRNQNELDSGFPTDLQFLEFGSYLEEGPGYITRRKTDQRDSSTPGNDKANQAFHLFGVGEIGIAIEDCASLVQRDVKCVCMGL
jgi:hypothetical protein